MKSRHSRACREWPQLSPNQPVVNRPTLAEVPLVDLFFGFVYGTVTTSAKAVEETVNNIPHVFEQAIERAANNTYARVFGS